jgi:hypothetical protein
VTDVGAPAIPGYAVRSNETITISGGGDGVGGRVDRFTFTYRELTGDGTIVARVTSLEDLTPAAKVGVMMRGSLSSDAENAFVFVSPTGGIVFQRRALAARETMSTRSASRSAPVWLKLERHASTVTASWSADGGTWTRIGSDHVPMDGVVQAGLAVTSGTEVAAARAALTDVSLISLAESGGALPAGWAARDIGSPSRPGTTSYSAGTFAMTGGGRDRTDTSDEFHYAYTQVNGDMDIVARVRSLGEANRWTRAGVMIRDSLTPGAVYAAMYVTARQGIGFWRRTTPGATTVATTGSWTRAPRWVKLSVRAGLVTAYESADGSVWIRVGAAVALPLPSPFYVGLAVTSDHETITVTTNIDGVQVQAPQPPANAPPAVSLTAPANGATFTAPATITVSATASDTDGTVSRVDFYQGSTLIGSDTTSPYGITWSSVPAGSYTLTARAVDNGGATTTSAARSITVNPASNTPPSVALTAPANGATFTAPATITVSATASDTNGTVSRVDFYQGSTLIGSDTTSPYGITWSSVPAGSYTLTARAVDNGGATTTSAARSISVTQTTTQRNAIFTASPDHATLVSSYLLEIFAAGANPATATPIATRNLGKPAVVNGDCTADVTSTINGLAAGNYQATVAAVGSGGTSTRSAPAAFSR